MVSLGHLFLVVIAQDFGLPVVVPERQDSPEIEKKDSYPVLNRQKREWVWNSLYWPEERRIYKPENIGKVWLTPVYEVFLWFLGLYFLYT